MKTLAQDIMSRNVLSVREGTSVEDALKLLVNSKVTGVPVVDQSGKMIGIYSEYDVIVQINESKKVQAKAFREPIRFSPKIEAVDEKTRLSKIMTMFVDSRFRRLPVLSGDGKLVGIITRRDLMKLFYYRATLHEEPVAHAGHEEHVAHIEHEEEE